MLYHETRDERYVQKFLGHKSIVNTEIYINIADTIFESKSDEFTVQVAEKPEEVKSLLEAGFVENDYACQNFASLHFWFVATLVLEVIDRGFDVHGDTPKQASRFFRGRHFNIDCQNVLENLDGFKAALQELFGSGCDSIESLFLRYLQETTGEDLNDCGSFADPVSCLSKKAFA